MKIQYALMSCNSNPRYAGYWPAVAAAWLKLNITPVLFFIPNNPKHQLPEAPGGIVHTMPHIEDVPIIIQALMLPFWGRYLYPNATIITTDINFFPSSNHFFHTQLKTYPDHAYLHLQPKLHRYFHDGPDQNPLHLDLAVGTSPYRLLSTYNIPEQTTTINKLPHLNSWWHIAKGETMTRVLELAPDWETTCRKTLSYYPHKDTTITISQFAWQLQPGVDWWWGDEIYTSIRLYHSDHQPIHYISYPSNTIQSRTQRDRYIGFHTRPLPYSSYQGIIGTYWSTIAHQNLKRSSNGRSAFCYGLFSLWRQQNGSALPAHSSLLL